MTSRTRTRLYRQRRKEGLVVLPVVAIEAEIVDALVSTGALALADADDRDRIAEALSRQVYRWMHSDASRHD